MRFDESVGGNDEVSAIQQAVLPVETVVQEKQY